MGRLASLKSLFAKKNPKRNTSESYYRELLRDRAPVFAAFGDNVYCSDIVNAAVAAIGREIGKLTLLAVQEKEIEIDGVTRKTIQQIKGGVNGLFGYRPNEVMTSRSLLEWIGRTVTVNDNAFLYPEFCEIPVGNGLVRREYTGIYGIKADTVGFDYAEDGTPTIGFASGGEAWVVPYSDVIHIRKRLGAHVFFGGNGARGSDTLDMLRSLRTMTAVEGGIEKAIQASLEIHGVMEMVGASEIEKRQKKLEDIESHVGRSKYGFLVTDFESNFKEFSIPLPSVPTDTLEWIENKVILPFGVSLPILRGDYTDEQYNAFYANTIEPIKTEIEQAFTACLFTKKEVVTFGKSVKAYDRLLMNLTLGKRIELLKVLHGTGVLINDEERALAGFEPNGEPTFVSLNYADKNMIGAYQMARAKLESKEKEETADENRTE